MVFKVKHAPAKIIIDDSSGLNGGEYVVCLCGTRLTEGLLGYAAQVEYDDDGFVSPAGRDFLRQVVLYDRRDGEPLCPKES